MKSVKPYQDYCKVNETWPQLLPSHWAFKQMRHLFNIYNGATPKSTEEEFWNGDIVWITPEDLGKLKGKVIDESIRKITESGYKSCGVAIAKAGSIAISTRAPIGHIAITSKESCVNQGCRLIEPIEGNTGFWYYCATASVNILQSKGQGTTFMELPRSSLASTKFPVPPLQEQKKIADFLDQKTAQIDTLIAKKEALLLKLQEKRSALITQAVTKGINPDAPMKPSGVEWLGDIPSSWQILSLRHTLLEPLSNGLFKKKDQWGLGTRIVDVYDIYVDGDVINEDSLQRVDCNEFEMNKYSAINGDFFFVRSSLKLDGIGKSALVSEPKEKIVFECHLVRGRPDQQQIDSTFLIYLLNSQYSRNTLISLSNQVTMTTLDQEKFKGLKIPLPPKDEQTNIAKYLGEKTCAIDKQLSKTKEVILKLNEYRMSLISHAVTGKIDVRDFTPSKAA